MFTGNLEGQTIFLLESVHGKQKNLIKKRQLAGDVTVTHVIRRVGRS